MDQDSFRQLLVGSSTTSRATSSSTPAVAATSSKSSKSKSGKPRKETTNGDNSSFKPRKVKELEGKYRDRAAERRQGVDADYDQVESILEEMERRKEDKVTKTADNEDDDEMLEHAFEQAPAKRTRADIIRELKEKRTTGETDAPSSISSPLPTEEPKKEAKITELKQAGKFKPIGFQPIGGDKAKKRKVKESKEGEERKKKKKKKEVTDPGAGTEAKPSSSQLSVVRPVLEEPEPEVDDIFAGVEEYQGLELDDDEEDENENEAQEEGEVASKPEEPSIPMERPRWFGEEDPDLAIPPPPPSVPPATEPQPELTHIQPAEERKDEDMEEEEQPMKLQPLHSSSVPSIKELLAMSDSSSGKRRKGKKGKKKKGGDESE